MTNKKACFSYLYLSKFFVGWFYSSLSLAFSKIRIVFSSLKSNVFAFVF